MSYSASFDRFDARPPIAAGRTISYERLLGVVIFLMLACSAISIIEPSPYDFLALLAVPMWLIGGPRIHASQALIVILWVLYTLVGFIALTPYWHEPDPRLFQIQSLFLLVTVTFFTFFFGQNTERRIALAMNGYIASASISAGVGLLGYVGLIPFGTMYEGRASGTFKDPNVLGSFLLLAIGVTAARLLLGQARRPALTWMLLGFLLAGQFLTFSRGAWLATVLTMALMIVFGFLRFADAAQRRRMIVMCLTLMGIGVVAIVAVLSDTETRELLLLRFSVTQDYDVGETGRFGNQMRAIITLLGMPEGFGPLRLRLTFDLDPHNSYIGAFANFGWVGGFLWIIIVATTLYVGFRLMWRRSPVQFYALAVVPATVAMLMQGFQIDIDHWRHVYIGFGAVWGLETARRRWQAYSEQRALSQRQH